MDIKLRRAFVPSELGEEVCGLCDVPFVRESVGAQVEGLDEGGPLYACEPCIEYFGRRNPKLFPTIAEYRMALRRYTEQMWESLPRELDAEHWDAAEVPRPGRS
ncbi:MAG: hypothetical protein M3315_11285 [Actinomycetota bacterium]|nr:hypothetical protein [Actinomycetota bacterium]